MKMNKSGGFIMNRAEIAEFSIWLNNNPRQRYKRFNEVVNVYLHHKESGIEIREVSCVS
jgi:cytidylate kinase